jgi:hypothetical protein
LPAADAADAFHLHDAVGEDIGYATDADSDEVEPAQAVRVSNDTSTTGTGYTNRFCISLRLYQHVIRYTPALISNDR